jgi:hypothetical protein
MIWRKAPYIIFMFSTYGSSLHGIPDETFNVYDGRQFGIYPETLQVRSSL